MQDGEGSRYHDSDNDNYHDNDFVGIARRCLQTQTDKTIGGVVDKRYYYDEEEVCLTW